MPICPSLLPSLMFRLGCLWTPLDLKVVHFQAGEELDLGFFLKPVGHVPEEPAGEQGQGWHHALGHEMQGSL